jgi:hypothetical protein
MKLQITLNQNEILEACRNFVKNKGYQIADSEIIPISIAEDPNSNSQPPDLIALVKVFDPLQKQK